MDAPPAPPAPTAPHRSHFADDESSDDSLLRAAPPSAPSPPSVSDSLFPSVLGSLRHAPAAGPSASSSSVFAQSPSFLTMTSSSDDDDHEFFGLPASSLQRQRSSPKPRTIVGTKSSFILGGKLGEGAYATVKEGIDDQSLRIVAVKVMDLRRLRKMRGSMERIDLEIAVQKRLKRHPHLIELIDVVRVPQKSKMYIILEMANGCTVQELAATVDENRLPESQVANFTYQTLKGLQYIHEKGIVHRDIKPANMILTANGELKISDFGVAEFMDKFNDGDYVSRTSGSPAFQSPEIAAGKKVYSGRKVDVWALGVTVYLLVTGNIPFGGETLILLFEAITKGEYEEPEWMSEECCDVIRRMLTVDAEKRGSVDELLRHPWILQGSVQLSESERKELGWVPIARKDFSILDVVKRMFNSDSEMPDGTWKPSVLNGMSGSGAGRAESSRQNPAREGGRGESCTLS